MSLPASPTAPSRQELGDDRLPNRVRLALIAAIGVFLVVLVRIVLESPGYVFPLAAALAGLAAMKGGFRLGLLVYFATTFGTEMLVPGVPVSLNRLAAGLLLACAAIEFLVRPVRFPRAVAFHILVIYHIYILSMAVLKLPPGGQLYYQPAIYLVVAILVSMHLWRGDWLRQVLWGFFVISVALTAPGIAEAVTGQQLPIFGRHGPVIGGRIDGLAVDAIAYAFIASWAILIGLYLFSQATARWERIGVLAGVGVLVACTLLTQNRQTPVILAAAVVTFILLYRGNLRRRLILAASVVAALAAPYVAYKIVQRFTQVRDFKLDPSLALRHDKILISREMLRDHPWTGIGHNYFQYIYKQYRPKGETVLMQDDYTSYHTIDMGYTQVITEYGIIGALLYVALMASLLTSLWRARGRALRAGDLATANVAALLAALYVQHLISNAVQDTFGVPRTYILIGLTLALLARDIDPGEPSEAREGSA